MPNKPKTLNQNCKIGDLVSWCEISGECFVGILKEWDNGTAIVWIPVQTTEWKTKAVRA